MEEEEVDASLFVPNFTSFQPRTYTHPDSKIVCLNSCLSLWLSVWLSVCLSVRLTVCKSVGWYFFLFFFLSASFCMANSPSVGRSSVLLSLL